MASHCHHHHHHCFATPAAAAASSCYCCCGCSCNPPQPPPATAAADPLLLQAIAAQLLQSPPPPIYSNQSLHYLYPNPNPSPPPPPLEHQLHQFHQKQTSRKLHRNKDQQHHDQKDLVESLLQRISALESTLPQTSSHTVACPDAPQTAERRPHPADRPRRGSVPRPAAPRRLASSVRDAAARTIQAQFRLYLIRRSQTLRDLKQLATIRSEVAALKSSLRYDSSHPHLDDLKAAQSRAVDLLEKLDYIQSSDTMIREGKRSISLDLIGITELTDGVVQRLKPNCFEEQPPLPLQFSKPATRRVTFADSSNEGGYRTSEDEEGNDTASASDTNETHQTLMVPGLLAPLPVKMESRRHESSDSTNRN